MGKYLELCGCQPVKVQIAKAALLSFVEEELVIVIALIDSW